MKEQITLGSLFDGSGGFPLGGLLAGIKPVWNSEIEPFPVRVTEKRLPEVQHYGDVSTLNGAELPPVDIITFGSPCQDLSVAGKRNGLDGSRSGLFFHAVRIIKEMRCATNGRYPRFCVWENVPGAFSSNGGEDFRSVLEEICKVSDSAVSVPRPAKWSKAGEILADSYSVAWRVLDACGWGVPQRRKRIYLVADFAGQCAGKILFESEGLSGYSPQGFRAWQGTAGSAENSTGTTGCAGLMFSNHGQDTRFKGPISVAETVSATYGMGGNNQPFVVESAGFCTEHSAQSHSIGYEEEKAPTVRASKVPAAVMLENHPTDSRMKICEDGLCQTLTSRMGTGGNNVPCLLAYGICGKYSNSMMSDNPHSGFYQAETSRTLDTSDQSPTKNQGGMAVVAYGLDRASYNQGRNAQFDFAVTEEVEPTMVAKGPCAVAQPVYSTSKASFHTRTAENLAETLVATDYKDPPIVIKDSFSFYPQMKAESQCFQAELANTLVNGTNPGYQNGVVYPEGLQYIVRRLTPTECARLQGFPDWWCSDLGTENPTEEEIDRWAEVFETHRRITAPDTKPKSRNAVIKWLKNPHSDSAEYKMWGNGVALPCVYFVLSGIAYYAQSAVE